jgi:hypothetical protein
VKHEELLAAAKAMLAKIGRWVGGAEHREIEISAVEQHCPICMAAVRPYPRYPRYVCRKCAERVRSADGRPLEFFNRNASGGFVARYADNGKPYGNHECFIDGVRCYADEAKLGGIVIQAIQPSSG